MKRDAFDRQAENASSDSWSGDAFAVSIKATVKLLRAQHRSFVRLVEREMLVDPQDCEGDKAYQQACMDILAALAAQGKGGKR